MEEEAEEDTGARERLEECDRKGITKAKGRICKVMARSAALRGMEAETVTKKREKQMEAEVRP